MDLSNFKINETVTVTLTNPLSDEDEPLTNDDGTPMTVEVYGPDSKPYRSAVHALQNERAKSGKKSLPPEEVEDQLLDLQAKCVKEWNITLNGENPKATVSKVKKVFTDYPFIRDQIMEKAGSRRDFISN